QIPLPTYSDRPHDDLAETSRFQGPACRLHREVVAVLLDDEQAALMPSARGDHLVTIRDAQGHRLLDHEVLSVLSELDHVPGVIPGRRQDVDHVNVRMPLEHLMVIDVARHVILRSRYACSFFLDIGDGHQFGPDMSGDERSQVTARNSTATYDTELQPVGCHRRPFVSRAALNFCDVPLSISWPVCPMRWLNIRPRRVNVTARPAPVP